METTNYLLSIRPVALCLTFLLLKQFACAQTDTTKKKAADVPQTEIAVTLSYDPFHPVALSQWDKDNKLPVKTTMTTPVDSINLSIKDGFIISISVHSGKQEFTNPSAPIAITSRRLNSGDMLTNANNNGESISIAEVLTWKFINSDVPDDAEINLTPKKSSIDLIRNLGVDNVLSIQLYTDALGLFGGTPNSLAQAEAQYRHVIHRRNVKDHGLMYPGQYLKINFSASKFDSKKRYVDSAAFSRTSLLQKSYLNLEASTNLIYIWLEKKSNSHAYIDLGTGINEGIVAKKKDTSSVLTPNIFCEAGLNLRPGPNIGVDLSIRYINQYSTQTNFVNARGMNQSNQEQFWKLGGALFYNPIDKSSGRIFTRFYYVIDRNHNDQVNNFLQFQFGYSILLSSVVGKIQPK